MDKEKEKIVNIIRSIVISCPKRRKPIRDIKRDYIEMVGSTIPIFEHKSLEEFLNSSGEFNLKESYGEVIISERPKKESQHIANFGAELNRLKNNFRSSGRHPLPRSYAISNTRSPKGSHATQHRDQATVVFTFDELQQKENLPEQNQVEGSIPKNQLKQSTIAVKVDELQQKENNLEQNQVFNDATDGYSSSGNSEMNKSSLEHQARGSGHIYELRNSIIEIRKIPQTANLNKTNIPHISTTNQQDDSQFSKQSPPISVKEYPDTQQRQSFQSKKFPSKSYEKLLFDVCKLNQLGTPVFKLIEKNNRFQCYVNIGNDRYSTYPMCYENENEARLDTTIYTLDRLVCSLFDVCLDNEAVLASKIFNCIKDCPAGVLYTKIPYKFLSCYRQWLPTYWKDVLVKYPQYFTIEDRLDGRIVCIVEQELLDTAEYTMNGLTSYLKKLDVCLDDEVPLAIKMYNCIKDNPTGVFLKKIPVIFSSFYKEEQLLPPDWKDILVKHPEYFIIDDCIDDEIVYIVEQEKAPKKN